MEEGAYLFFWETAEWAEKNLWLSSEKIQEDRQTDLDNSWLEQPSQAIVTKF